MKPRTSKAIIIAAIALSVITCMTFVGCGTNKGGCYSTRGMSGYK